MTQPLPDDIAAEVVRLFDEGEILADEEEDEEALACFQAAWNLLPEPRCEWDQALQILLAIADSHFHLGDYETCCQKMQFALGCGGDVDNPFICLRLGQCYLELGNEQDAGNWLVTALAAEGVEVFANEDPKYWAFLKERLDPPPGGWPEGW
jgi:hypothetical protein